MIKTYSSSVKVLSAALAALAASAMPYGASQAQTTLTAETRSCEWANFGSLAPIRCIKYGTTAPGNSYTGAIGKQTPHCPTIPVGQVVSAVTPPTGGSSCFQFVTTGAAVMPVEVALPPNVTGIVELFVVIPNGAGFKLSEARTGTPLALNFSVSTAHRIGVLFRPFSGPGGQNMNIGVNVSAPAAPTALNDTAANAADVAMAKAVSSTITTPGTSAGYYFYPLDTGETQANYNVVRTSNQTVGIRAAQRVAPNVYTMGTETIVPVSGSGQTYSVTSSNSNTAGTTTPYGFMVRVSGTNVSAPADEPYSVRVSGGRNHIFQTTTANTENISRYFPISEIIQVATYLTVTAKIKDGAGNFVPKEPVTFDFKPYNNGSTVLTATGVTDEYGVVTVTSATFPACTGPVQSATWYGPFGSPADKWNGTAQSGSVKVKVVGSNPPTGYFTETTIPFTRICSETYQGQH